MRIPRQYGWAWRRAREVLAEEGPGGVRDRAVSYARRRRLGATGPEEPRMPRGTVAQLPSTWARAVVIVADRQPVQCYRYRVEQKQQICRHLGVPLRVVSPHDPAAVHDALQVAGLVIIFRQAPHAGVRIAVEQARRLGVPVVFEADDAVHRRDLVADNPNLATVPAKLRRSVIAGADDYLAALRLADHVLASTAPLAADMAEYVSGQAFVVENGIDETMAGVAAALAADPAPPPKPEGAFLIGYGSGSRAHDADLAVAAGGLAEAMARNPAVRLRLMGPVSLPPQLADFGDRVDRLGEMDYPEYLRQLGACDATIAPLLDLPFNYFKSQVKVLEAAVMGVPLVASPTVYESYVVDGATGLLAEPAGWGKALGRLIADPDLRAVLTAGARTAVAPMQVRQRPAEQFAEMVQRLCPLPEGVAR